MREGLVYRRSVGVVREFLDSHLHGRASPFLFVGSGLTRRYTGCDDWEGLLRRFATETDQPYEYYRTSAAGDLPTVASRLAAAFHDVWWRDDRFAASRDRWANEVAGVESALKVEVAAYVATSIEGLPQTGPLADEIALLRQAVVDGIISTNFDPVLETLFPDLRVFVGQDQMLFANPQGVGEIYKIHGSCEQPDSLVLTAADYERFEARNAYLAAKLLTIFVEHPVIFLGYSMGDRNVQTILRSIGSCLTQDNIEDLRDRLVFVQWEPDQEPNVGPHSILLEGSMVNVIRVQAPDFIEVFESLAGLSRTFPAQLLRRLKEHVYQLVLTDDPSRLLYVQDIDDADNGAVDVVFGVGVRRQLGHTGYVGLDRWDLIDDVVNGTDGLDPLAVVVEALPQILRAPGNVPTYKFLRGAGMLTRSGSIKRSVTVDQRIVTMADKHKGGDPASKWHKDRASQRLAGVAGIAALEAVEGPSEVFTWGTCMPPSRADVDELRDFLQRHRSSRHGSNWDITQYAKLTCYLDWLEYGRAPG